MLSIQDIYSVFVPDTTFGFGAINKLGETVKRLGCIKPVIITDEGIMKAGLIERIESSLKNHGIPYSIFSKCEPDAPLTIVDECLGFVRKGNFDAVIAVGGGSVIDTAKLVGVAALGNQSIVEYMGTDKIQSAGIRKIYIPTTTGTASEWSATIVATNDLKAGTIIKVSFRTPYFRPDAVFVDPQLTMNLPQNITAQTGIDALSHAIEAFTCIDASVVSDMFAVKSIQLVSKNLRAAYAQGSRNPEARYNMAIGATLAFAFSISGVGIGHAMANPLATLTHISHGESLAIVLPAIMEFNMIADLPKYAQVATLMGDSRENLPLKERAILGISLVRDLIKDVGLNKKMREVGVKKEDIAEMVDIAMNKQHRLVAFNPRKICSDEMKKIYESIW